MNELVVKENIKTMIYEIRGKQVMLDSDLAKLYQVETKRINEAVKRNPLKFPERYTFQLTVEESQTFLVAICDQKLETRGGRYQKPRVFTEQGIAMLATILKTPIATQVSIAIMDAFVSMRHFLIENKDIYMSLNNINNKLDKHEEHLILLDNKTNQLFNQFQTMPLKEKIYFEGQIYDAYSKIVDILKMAKEECIIIDSYADKSVLDMISNIKVNIILITKEKGLLKEIDIKKYNEQYHNLKVIYSNDFHDRFIILDKEIIYHLGTSLNHAGKRIFAINKLEDKEIKKALLDKIITK